MAANRSFRHRNANTFLTYSKCDHSPQLIADHLWDLLKSWNPIYILVASEHHADGSLHSHALVQTEKQVNTTNQRFFDILEFHPNIQSAKSVNKVRTYILKNPVEKFERGTFVPRKSPFLGESSSSEKKHNKDDVMRDIIDHATSKEEYLSMVQKALPYDWATKLSYFEYSADRLFPVEVAPFINPHPPSEPDLLCQETITDWLQNDLFQVSAEAYCLLNPTCYTREEAISDLQWMSDYTRSRMGSENAASTSSVQQELESLLGPEA
nr:replication-associated protein A [Digitaria streak virus]